MIWALMLVEVILFVTGIYYINKHDEETVIKVSLKEYVTMERTLFIMIFSMTAIMQGTLGWMGWGDVLTYIGCFFWLASVSYDCITVEVFLVYMLIANLFFLICNMKKFDWKNKTLMEETAYLPSMAIAMGIMLLG